MMAEVEERQCYICLEMSEGSWVTPCRCTGTLAWVHQECLLHWVREQEEHNVPSACAQCLTRFVLLPDKGPLLSSLDLLYNSIIPACKCVAGCFIAVLGFDSTCVTMGVCALALVHGVDETIVILMDYVYEQLVEAVAHLQLITYSLVLISSLPWEYYLLRVLHVTSRLPLLSSVLPADVRPVLFHEPPRKQSPWSVLGNAILLQVFGRIIGTLLFSEVKSSLSRVMIGGAVYLTLECVFFMYIRQKWLIRQREIQVLSIEEATETGQ